MSPTRVVFVITDSGIGGTEKTLFTLLQRLDRSRYVPAGVIVLKRKREMAKVWETTGVPVVELGMGKFPTPAFFWRLRSALRRMKPDVVSAFLFHAIQFTRLIRLTGLRYRLVTSPRVNYRFAPAVARFLDRLGRGLDSAVVAESEAGRQALISDSGYNPDRIQVAPNGVDTRAFAHDAAARARLRKEWGIPAETVLVGSVGRLHSQKGYDNLIQAAARLRGIPVPFTMAIAGTGPEDVALEALATQLNVHVTWLGQRLDVAGVLSAFDIYVQSSRYEGLSNALLEAMSAGCACVATAVDGTRDVAQDGKNLLLVRPDDYVSLGVALGVLLERPALRRTLAENATLTARSRSVDAMVAAFQAAFDRALS